MGGMLSYGCGIVSLLKMEKPPGFEPGGYVDFINSIRFIEK